MKIKEEYVSFETAKMMKDKGFEGINSTFYYCYNSEGELIVYSDTFPSMKEDREKFIVAPTLSLAMKWLWKEYGILVNVMLDVAEEIHYGVRLITYDKQQIPYEVEIKHESFDEYEEALRVGIMEALKLI